MKIKAFTILEMIVNLALMSVIVSMVYVVYLNFSQNFGNYTGMSTASFEIQAFHTLMQEDFYGAEKVVSKSPASFEVVFYTSRTISYHFKNSRLTRQDGPIATSITAQDFQISVLSIGTANMDEQLVDEVSFTSQLFKQEVPLTAYKNYISNHLISLE